jgi:hypothetical protein
MKKKKAPKKKTSRKKSGTKTYSVKVKVPRVKSTKSRPFSQPALKLIDQAASLLRRAVLAGEEKTVEGRRLLKRNALDFVEVANRRLHAAVREGTSAAHKGLNKL